MPLPKLETIDRSGKPHVFFYEEELEKEPGSKPYTFVQTIRFRVHLLEDPSFDDKRRDHWYEAAFTAVPGLNEVQVTALENQGRSHYKGQGIAEALFDLVARRAALFPGDKGRRTLVSSSNKDRGLLNTEYRTPFATKVWERLREAGRAKYDAAADRYTYLLPEGV